MHSPILRVDELLVRPWRPADAEAMARACQDPLLQRWMPGLPAPYSPEHARTFITAQLGDLSAWHLGIFDESDLVGSVVLHGIDQDAGTAGLGYWSASWARGRRVTERAARALLRYAFAAGLVRIGWRATVGNHASRLTALRLGFTLIGTQPGTEKTPDQWLGSLFAEDLTAPGAELPDPVRRAARVFSGEPPRLTAGQVTLRRPVPADVPAMTAGYNDPDVARWFGVPEVWTTVRARDYVDRQVPQWWTGGVEAVFAIADHLDSYVGSVDLSVRRDDPAVGEVGYFVRPDHRRRGYAAAAVRAISRWGFAELGLERIQIRWEAGNAASGRVAAKAGFTSEGLMRQALVINGRRRDCWVASLLRDEVE
ncbi:GNAT family N-acetyltransferase [Actinoplanes sp. N902-109]|uniref:GNAT family N-acetyltransferase n=1 Tax=Actinoplanes sp. (strain N902-109) TaxID=649831 RepID=UPI0003294C73|nr:GNAT family N-acetyltransferase [Actinoplanes sp. N902-109]AGL14689.1 GCN5-like N-acetyltransferase [Actinoplanes sp. N902-109]